MTDYPSIVEAEKILQNCIDFRERLATSPNYIPHCRMVSEFARKIAVFAGMDGDKAYVLGLLHDCGKRKKEQTDNIFHGQEGYDFLMSLGYPKAAQICMTHTFPDKNFNVEEVGYPAQWMIKAKEILNGLEYDDYDRLIQLCDKMSAGASAVTVEERALAIKEFYAKEGSDTYNVTDERYKALLKEGQELKAYFDKLCGRDVYEIIGLKKPE